MIRRFCRRSAWPGIAAAAWLFASGVSAQDLPFGAESGDEPVEITAQESLEWRQDLQSYVARGNAVLIRGDLTVSAAILTADYREDADGRADVYRATAEGNVVIESADGRATADSAVYNLDEEVAVLRGESLRLETADGIVTATDSLEYWRADGLAVARGNAVVVREDQTVEADLLTGEFVDGADDGLELVRVSAQGNVIITTDAEVILADEAVYDLRQEVAVLTGNVRLTRGENQLNGDFAEVNLATGVSRIMAAPGSGGRVNALLTPE